MNVSLTPELERLVENKIASGMYQTASEVVREALRLLKARDEHSLEALRRDVESGFEAISRGRFTDYEAKALPRLATSVKSRGRTRLRDRAAKQRTSP